MLVEYVVEWCWGFQLTTGSDPGEGKPDCSADSRDRPSANRGHRPVRLPGG